MIRFCFSISLLFISIFSVAGDIEYPFFTIPKALIKNARAVIRLQEVSVVIKSPGKYIKKEKIVITILDESGDGLAGWRDSYSNFRSIDHIEGALYDALGNKIRGLKKAEIKDFPAYDDNTLANDDRMKTHAFHYKSYPYTVVYESEVSSSLTMFLPMWKPVAAIGISVEKSLFNIEFEKDAMLHRRQFNFKQEPIITTAGNKTNWRWELKQQEAFITEYAAPSIYDLLPFIEFTMGNFKMEEFNGSLNSWKEYGDFIMSMRAGLENLPQETKTKVASLTAGLNSDGEKVRVLYDYLQKHSHYISVQIGIGGWRPFPASYVAQKGYGDCKALSNFMVTLLKEAGIKAYYVLISASPEEKRILPDFPSPNFNHAICAVPLQKDTIWLECTSQTKPAGYAGSATGNRLALLITEEGGKLVATPSYNKLHNIQRNTVDAVLSPEGHLQMKANNNYLGQTCETGQYVINTYSKEEQLKYLKTSLDIPSYDISSFSLTEKRSALPVVNEEYELDAPHYAQVSGKRIFFVPNVLNQWGRKLLMDTARMYSIELNDDQTEIDSVTFTIPNGYKLENGIKPLQLNTPFGNYQVAATFENNQVRYLRKLSLNRGKFEAKQFNDLVKFYDQLYKTDRAKIVLVKSE